ncbi:hypothetical protein [Streptomyces lavendulae]|uniref:hypothetical protein n=1 Tax=Streptomyces lavendulae TaxID=1914 RepID=UPI0024A1C4A8|nr:hypothetical protein [Streptomyces lavendulae]GLW04257.1 hypothetical protein Slala05_78870 [Streptomyces lavendulae subsp. lavendulae]
MSASTKPSSQDTRLEEVFGAPVGELYAQAVAGIAPPTVSRALELRSFLALTEEQVARVRDRVHAAMAPDRDMNELSAAQLRMDSQWLDAALSARGEYLIALGELLTSMPAPTNPPRQPVAFDQQRLAARLSPRSPSAALPPVPAKRGR